MLLQAIEVDREIFPERCRDRDDDTVPWSCHRPRTQRLSSRRHVIPPLHPPLAAQHLLEPTAVRRPYRGSAGSARVPSGIGVTMGRLTTGRRSGGWPLSVASTAADAEPHIRPWHAPIPIRLRSFAERRSSAP